MVSYLLHCGAALILIRPMPRAVPGCSVCAANTQRIWPHRWYCCRNAWSPVPMPGQARCHAAWPCQEAASLGPAPSRHQTLGSSDSKSCGARGPGCGCSQQLGGERFKASHFGSGCLQEKCPENPQLISTANSQLACLVITHHCFY